MTEKYDNDGLRKDFIDQVLNAMETLYSEAKTDGEKALMCIIAGSINDSIEFTIE